MSMDKRIDFHLPSADKVKTAGEATDLAIDWQSWQSEQSLSYGEAVYYQNYFEALAERFNLTDEFKENGII